MKLSLAEPKYLKDSISIVSELVNEVKLKVTSDAIELVAMDPANVAMVMLKLLSSCFVEYKVDGDQELAINLSNLKSILKRAKPTDMVILEMEDNALLKITLKGKSTRTFSMPIIDIEDKEQKPPSLKFPVTIKTKADVLNEAIEDADVVGESVVFEVDKNRLLVQSEGDLSKANIDIPADDETSIIKDTAEKIRAKYSIEYLKKMIVGGKIASDVTLQFNKDYPMKLEYKAVDKVLMSFILAPRVESD